MEFIFMNLMDQLWSQTLQFQGSFLKCSFYLACFRNRGHGIVIEQALDGRVFVNQTKIYDNWGDGVWYNLLLLDFFAQMHIFFCLRYRQMHPSLSLIERFYGFGIGSSKQISSSISQSRTNFFLLTFIFILYGQKNKIKAGNGIFLVLYWNLKMLE